MSWDILNQSIFGLPYLSVKEFLIFVIFMVWFVILVVFSWKWGKEGTLDK